MANRSIFGHNAHFKGIYREAINLKRDGWHVMADHIPGYDQPPEIEGYIPDIYAIKDNHTFIIEIETDADDDKKKHIALKRYANHFPEIRFNSWIVNEAGCRVEKID